LQNISLPLTLLRRLKPDVFDSDSENEAGPEERLILKIHGTRTHVSTDGMLEYRLEIAPKQLVRMAESGIKGTRVPEGPDEWASEEDEDEDARTGKGKGGPIDPETHLRLWMPACMVALVEPQLVEEYENFQAQRAVKKSKGNRAATRRGKTNQTTSKAKSNAKGDASAEMELKTSRRSHTPISRSTQIETYGKVIEVSSDSDSDSSLPSRIALPPLIAARVRATTKSIQATTLSQPCKKAESEIIDLT
jgi:Holliday junction resolvase YEN1